MKVRVLVSVATTVKHTAHQGTDRLMRSMLEALVCRLAKLEPSQMMKHR